MQQDLLSKPRTTLLRIMLAINALNSGSWAVFLLVRYFQGTEPTLMAFASSTAGSVLALIGLALTFGRYEKASGWILVATLLSSTLFSCLYLTPLQSGMALFFLSVPVTIAALMISGRAGIGAFFISLIGMSIVVLVRHDMAVEETAPPLGFVTYLSAIVIVATFVKERFERAHRATLEESAKMASLGQMSAGIAHEINNPLFVVNVAALQLEELILEEPIDRARIIELTRKISQMTIRIDQTVKGLKQFAREASSDPMRSTPVRDIINSTKELCRHRFAEAKVQLTLAEVPTALGAQCRPAQISQILVNLLNNAIDAVAGTTDAWVKIDIVDLGDAVTISVTDSGPGIPEDVRRRIMTPFFTTKAEGKGTGLGLSLSLAIARDHGGRLYLDENATTTRFVLELPKVQPARSSHS